MIPRPLALTLLAGTVLLTACPGDDAPPVEPDDGTSGSSDTGSLPPPPTGPGPDTDPDPSTGMEDSTSNGTTSIDPDSSTGEDLCGNGTIDGDEVCDGTEISGETCESQGYDTGTLGCAADCSGYDISGCMNFNCGNGTIEGSEVCDGTDVGGVTCQSEGFDSGSVECALNCSSIDTSGCGTCGNVIVDGDEICDSFALFGQTCESQGYTSGQLGCLPDCQGYDTANCIQCGNDLIDGIEPCDGTDLAGQTCQTMGFVGGTLACDADCSDFDLSGCNSCGNDIIDGGESCDGANLGGQTCASIGLLGGTLGCSASCSFDTSACDIPGFPFGGDGFYNGYYLEPVPLPCDDISGTGTPLGLFDDDQTSVPIGFPFAYYGASFNDVTIASNGAIYFNSIDYLDYTNVCLPGDTFSPVTDYLLAAFWDDLDPSSAGEVRYQSLGVAPNRRFVVQWDVPFFGGDIFDLIRVQAVLNETGSIQVCYPDTLSAMEFGNSGAGATAGIQLNPMTGFQYSCDAATITNGLMLLYLPV